MQSGLEPLGSTAGWPWSRVSGVRDGRSGVSYIYFGEHRPVIWTSGLPADSDNYDVDLIDTWDMTVTPAKKVAAPIPHPTRHGTVITARKAEAAFGIELPGKPYLALRVTPRAS